MITETALALAGPDAHLVSRPRGVAHVFTGLLSRTGSVPRAARPVCRVRTRRLRAVPPVECSPSLDVRASHGNRRVCARCAARLDRDLQRSRRAASSPVSRRDWATAYAGITKADLAVALEVATTAAEVAQAAWLTLLLFEVGGCNDQFTAHGRRWSSLHDCVRRARGRVHGFPENPLEPSITANREAAEAAANARRREVARERDARRGLTQEDRDHALPR